MVRIQHGYIHCRHHNSITKSMKAAKQSTSMRRFPDRAHTLRYVAREEIIAEKVVQLQRSATLPFIMLPHIATNNLPHVCYQRFSLLDEIS